MLQSRDNPASRCPEPHSAFQRGTSCRQSDVRWRMIMALEQHVGTLLKALGRLSRRVEGACCQKSGGGDWRTRHDRSGRFIGGRVDAGFLGIMGSSRVRKHVRSSEPRSSSRGLLREAIGPSCSRQIGWSSPNFLIPFDCNFFGHLGPWNGGSDAEEEVH